MFKLLIYNLEYKIKSRNYSHLELQLDISTLPHIFTTDKTKRINRKVITIEFVFADLLEILNPFISHIYFY